MFPGLARGSVLLSNLNKQLHALVASKPVARTNDISGEFFQTNGSVTPTDFQVFESSQENTVQACLEEL